VTAPAASDDVGSVPRERSPARRGPKLASSGREVRRVRTGRHGKRNAGTPARLRAAQLTWPEDVRAGSRGARRRRSPAPRPTVSSSAGRPAPPVVVLGGGPMPASTRRWMQAAANRPLDPWEADVGNCARGDQMSRTRLGRWLGDWLQGSRCPAGWNAGRSWRAAGPVGTVRDARRTPRQQEGRTGAGLPRHAGPVRSAPS
jgi:hypothetical protein